MIQSTGGNYAVWYTRFGVLLYYPADTLEDARRWVRVYAEVGEGEIEILYIVTPSGDTVDCSATTIETS